MRFSSAQLRVVAPLFVLMSVLLSAALLLTPTIRALATSPSASHPPGNAPPNLDWRSYGNDLGDMRYVNTDQITTANVSQLQPAWILHTNVKNMHTSFESQPLEVNGTVYISSPHNHVFALDAVTGAIRWTYNPTNMPPLADLALCCGQTSRGIAYGEGMIYEARQDDVLVALNATTGSVVWETRIADFHEKYAENAAPLYVNGKVLIGISGGEFEQRGFITAYDARSGHQIWRFYTAPGPGQTGNNTWAGTSWQNGGADPWTTPEADPQLGMVYVQTGNAAPDVNGSSRAGNNLFSASLVALDLNTGQLRWHFQEVHHDIWDYDAGQPAHLFTLKQNGQAIPTIGHACKDGFYFILDRRTGKPITSVDPVKEVSVPTDPAWQHASPTQPVSAIPLIPMAVTSTPPGYKSAPMFTPPREQPLLMQPGAEMSGPEWGPAAYSPRTKYAYIAAGGYAPWLYHAMPDITNTYGSTGTPPFPLPTSGIHTYGLFDAVDTTTGKIAWKTRVAETTVSGVAVAGDLVFWGEDDGTFIAQDARSGRILWHWKSKLPGIGGANGAPAVYSVNGREYIVMAFGGSSHVRGDLGKSASPLGDALVAFALPRPGDHGPNMVTAHPIQVPIGAPKPVAGTTRPPRGALVVTLNTHDLNYSPNHFSVPAGARVAVHLVNNGTLPASFAVELPGGAIGLASPVKIGHDIYFTFTAPSQPGQYSFFSAIAPDKYSGMTGSMTVTAA